MLWDTPHYRAASFGTDIADNLRNVAVPGTGLALSIFTRFGKLSAAVFIAVVYPILCLIASAYQAFYVPGFGSPSRFMKEYLLDPVHWFAVWRLNCLAVAYHSFLHMPAPARPAAKKLAAGSNRSSRASIIDQYAMEDKGAFLLAGAAAGLPVTPFLTSDQLPELVAKHKSVEGGMGIHFFSNFASGGDWILQPRLRNSDFLARLLPPGAPLSTLRIITLSRNYNFTPPSIMCAGECYNSDTTRPASAVGANGPGNGTAAAEAAGAAGVSAEVQVEQEAGGGGAAGGGASTSGRTAGTGALAAAAGGGGGGGVEVVTVVLRAGRAGAKTDHDCCAFSVDPRTGAILQGTSNMHWYRLGWQHAGRLPPPGPPPRFSQHPDTPEPLTGHTIPDFSKVLGVCTAAHLELLPQVPLVGWDVALTPQGPMLLELNISCNFFNGSYDRESYVAFMHTLLCALQGQEEQQGRAQGQGGARGKAE